MTSLDFLNYSLAIGLWLLIGFIAFVAYRVYRVTKVLDEGIKKVRRTVDHVYLFGDNFRLMFWEAISRILFRGR